MPNSDSCLRLCKIFTFHKVVWRHKYDGTENLTLGNFYLYAQTICPNLLKSDYVRHSCSLTNHVYFHWLTHFSGNITHRSDRTVKGKVTTALVWWEIFEWICAVFILDQNNANTRITKIGTQLTKLLHK